MKRDIFLLLILSLQLPWGISMFSKMLNGSGIFTVANPRNDSEILSLVQFVMAKYLIQCNVVVLYHPSFQFDSPAANFELRSLLTSISVPFSHGQTGLNGEVPMELLEAFDKNCRSFLIFIDDVRLVPNITGSQPLSKVVVITSSSPWKIQGLLEGDGAKVIVNLLVIAIKGASDVVIQKNEERVTERFLNMYTHELYVDGVGGSKAKLLTSWRANSLSRQINLFPPKIKQGFNARQFAVVASTQAPFTVKKNLVLSEEAATTALWDGIELRLLRLLSQYLNYTYEIKEAKPTTSSEGPANVVLEAVAAGSAEIGIAGVFTTPDVLSQVALSSPHSVDCAVFVTRTSTALPRYRAILGPFHWTVWLGLTLTYIFGILPLTFADQHSLRYLWDNPWHFETMFWYVFGTFTNCFTFKGRNSWTTSDKNATRLLVGWYWAFSVIVTACYTGSIIAFITLFVFPPVIDDLDQLVEDNYRVGTLSYGEWPKWFNDSDHPKTKWLLRDLELVPSLLEGLKNVTGSYYLPLLRPYTFLASRAELDYIIKSNFTMKNKKDLLHVTKTCFVPFGVSFVFPNRAPYQNKLNEYILRAQQSGLIKKLFGEMQWDLLNRQRMQAGSGGPLNIVGSSDRRLTLDDTQGMFLLLGAGFLIATAALISESTRHRGLDANSWKFWLWRPSTAAVGRYQSVREWLRRFELEKVRIPKPEGFLFKTYDSRVLNSRYRGVEPHAFSPEELKSRQRQDCCRAASYPSIQQHEDRNGDKSTSCSVLVQVHADADAKEPNKILRERFGSIASATPWYCPRELSTPSFLQDRPQTSLF